MKITDDLGRIIPFEKIPERVVSLVPSLTLTLFDLGLGARITAITRFCKYPETSIKLLPKAGGPKNIDIDKITGLNPDVVFAVKEENNREQILKLADRFPVVVFDVNNINDSYRMLQTIGELFQIKQRVLQVTGQLKNRIQSLNQTGGNGKTVYLIWKKPFMAAGNKTYIGSMLQATGYNNIVSGRYPEVGSGVLQKAETILLATEPFHFKKEDKEELQRLYPGKTVQIVNGEFFTWFGTYLISKNIPDKLSLVGA